MGGERQGRKGKAFQTEQIVCRPRDEKTRHKVQLDWGTKGESEDHEVRLDGIKIHRKRIMCI